MEPNFIEYLTANEHIAYPFGEDAPALVDQWDDVIVTGLNPTMPKDFLSDAVILVPAEYVGYLYLYSITCVSLTEYAFDIRDESGSTLISFSVSIAAPAPEVHSVIQEVTSSPPIYAVRMLTGPTFVSYLEKIGADLGVGNTALFMLRLSFETGAIEFRPDRVSKIRFKDTISEIVYDLDEDVGVYEGFNIGLTGEESSISILAEPGAGAGRNDEECGGTPVPSWYDTITSLQGTKPDEDGNINIKGTPCHRVEPDPANHRLIIYNDCQPCCLCQDYANVATALDGYFNRLRKVWQGSFLSIPGYENFLALVSTHNSHVQEYNGPIFPKIRTFTFWGHVMVGTANFDARGSVQSSATATMGLVLTNRCSQQIEVEGTILWSKSVDLVEVKAQGTDGGTLELESFSVTMEPFSELHFFWHVKSSGNESLTGLQATVTAKWTQYGVNKTLTRTVE
jgi:hypothetical protein